MNILLVCYELGGLKYTAHKRQEGRVSGAEFLPRKREGDGKTVARPRRRHGRNIPKRQSVLEKSYSYEYGAFSNIW